MKSSKYPIAVISLCVILAAYVLVCMLVFEKSPVFWAELAFTVAAFVLAGLAIVQSRKERFFLNLPLYAIASFYLVVQLVASLIVMAIGPICEPWCYVISIILLAAYLCTFLAAKATMQHITSVDEQVKKDTSFMKELILQLECLRDELPESQRDQISQLINSAKYSNLRSCEASQGIEKDIHESMNVLKEAIRSNNESETDQVASRLNTQIKQRDRVCKAR